MMPTDREVYEATISHAAHVLELADRLAQAAQTQWDVYGAYPGLVAALKDYQAERD